MRTLALASTTAALLLGVAGCGGRGSTRDAPVALQAPRSVAAPRRSDDPGGVVRVIRTAYGPALVDRRGFALYIFTHDRSAASTCFGACAAAWPPYEITKQPLAAGTGAHGALLGTTPRADGRLQVTYAGHPLYFYVGDTRPREVLCQGVEQFGGTWFVEAPGGNAIQ